MRELRESAGTILRIVVLVLAVMVVWQLAGVVVHWNPFRGVTVPELPSLAANTNAPGGGLATNPAATDQGTNHPRPLAATNTLKSAMATNTAPTARTTVSEPGTNMGTNAVVPGTNALVAGSGTGTNAASVDTKTKRNAHKGPRAGMAGMNFNPFGQPGPGLPELPPAVQARIGRIVDSEILGPVMRPLPMALLGIAGDVAFLRSANGQTGLVKAGDSLDDIKLLRIGVNRVLIEQAGDKKELTIFDGYGGESLLPDNSTNENHHP